MRRLFGILIAAALIAVSCDGTAGLEKRRDDAAGRLDALTKAIDDMNEELALLQAVASGSTVSSVDGTGTEWKISLSNGTVVTIAKGDRPVGQAPVMSLDADGCWQVDYGKGPKNLTYADGTKVGATGIDFTVPVFGVDAGGFWTVSLDGGTSFTQVRDAGGNPVKALPEGGVDSFFSDVSFDGTTLTLTLRDGSVYKAPVVPEFSFSIVSAGSKVIFAPGERKAFPIASSGVESTVVFAPSGWTAAIESGQLKVTAPASVRASSVLAQASADVAVLAVSSRGYSTIARLQVEVDWAAAPADTDMLEVWNEGGSIVIAGIPYSKSAYGEAAVLKATEADQALVPSLSAGTKLYFLEQQTGCNFALTGGSLDCDAILVSRYPASPATIRFKAATTFSDKSLAVKDVVFDARAASVIGFTLSSAATALSPRFHFDGCRFNWKYNKNLISLASPSSEGGIRSIRIVNSAIDMRVDESATRMTFILTSSHKHTGEMEELLFENNRVAYDVAKPFNIVATGATSSSSSGGPVVTVRRNTFYNATPAQTLLFIDTLTGYDISGNIWSVPSGGCGGYLIRTTVGGVSASGTMTDNIAYGTEGTLYTFHGSSTLGTKEKISYVASNPVATADQDAMKFVPVSAYSAFGAK